MAKKHLAVLRADIYHEGANFLGVAEVTLPEFGLSTTDVSGFGLPGTFTMPNQGQMAAALVTLSFPVMDADGLDIFKLGHAVSIDLRNVHGVVDSPTLNIETGNVRWALRLAITKFNPGKIKPGETNDASVEGSVMRAQMWVDGESKFTFGFFTDEFEQGGTDIAGQISSALSD